MDSIPRSIFILILLMILSAFFSASETAFSFANHIRIRISADDGDKKARRAEKTLDMYDRVIVTFLILYNVLNISIASVSTVLFVRMLALGESVGSVVATLVTTVAVFIFVETIPKNIARVNADRFVLAISGVIYVLVRVLWPVSYVFTAIGDLVKKIFGIDESEPTVTEDEFSLIVDNAETEGLIEPEETEIIKSAIEFGDCVAADVMTPIDKVVGISVDCSEQQVRDILVSEKYSRFPVYKGNINNIIGVLQSADSLWKLANGIPLKLKDSLKKPYFIKSGTLLNNVFEGMCGRRCHFAVVTGDENKVIGIMTMEDILEEIVGEIYDESDDPAISVKEES